ncbi:MAG: lipocalin-like domain-containing protein [Richelia sp. RM2_1_2]|nr:lipocalin-like domain-containing protein [Richelia sp. SM2_1_7]NJM18292.1 lipocalin-like domain-containing protein [Richelia sp. SM1_7_0]NJN08389.1 lipocalin-like domain-containing protein [Richelia sp. RM1_1_1]NJO26931.1 lipocalin-like domain-containing protein [Richelia sp. SL_2_1]NJO63159.1 lipocalin-like domain-containing protein [Richelia sp. RM2_1_2]NJS16680.1 lipocalin-like domain-containing protein [Nostocaceae cyanobacterium CSU_2_110]
MSSFSENNPLLGTWKLISITAIFPDGKIDKEAFGINPIGYITYTPEGKIMVIFSKSERPLLSGNSASPLTTAIHSVPIEERSQAFSNFNSYAGSYTLDGNTVIHHVEIALIPNRVGKSLTRTFTLNENRITLTTPLSKSDDTPKFELVWERI